jgi:hypothetical protein
MIYFTLSNTYLLSVLRLFNHVLTEFGQEVVHNSRIEHFLNLAHFSLFIKPQKDTLLVSIRPERSVGLCHGVESSLTPSGVMNNVVYSKLLSIRKNSLKDKSLTMHTLKFDSVDMRIGKSCSSSSRERVGFPELNGSAVCVQSGEKLERKTSGCHDLHPLMNFSIVFASTSAAAGMATGLLRVIA